MKPTGITREQLLAGVTRHNKGEFHAREDSEETPANVGAGVEERVSGGSDAPSGDTGGGFQTGTNNLPPTEVSLEVYLHAKVISSRTRIKSIESQIAYSQHELDVNIARKDKLHMELDLSLRILEDDYGHEKRAGRTEGEVPSKRRSHKAEARKERRANDTR